MIVVDIETSGLDPTKHGILSIGAVDFNNPDNFFYAEPRLGLNKEIDPIALKINGFVGEDVKNNDKKSLNDVLHEFNVWLTSVRNVTFAGQNPSFDAGFLKQAFEENGFYWPFGHRYMDLHSTAMSTYLSKGFKIPEKSGRYMIDLDGILWSVGLEKRGGIHNGLMDAKLEAEAFSRLIHSNNWSKEFSGFPICLKNPIDKI